MPCSTKEPVVYISTYSYLCIWNHDLGGRRRVLPQPSIKPFLLALLMLYGQGQAVDTLIVEILCLNEHAAFWRLSFITNAYILNYWTKIRALMDRTMRRFKQLLTEEENIEILRSTTSGVLSLCGDDGFALRCSFNSCI